MRWRRRTSAARSSRRRRDGGRDKRRCAPARALRAACGERYRFLPTGAMLIFEHAGRVRGRPARLPPSVRILRSRSFGSSARKIFAVIGSIAERGMASHRSPRQANSPDVRPYSRRDSARLFARNRLTLQRLPWSKPARSHSRFSTARSKPTRVSDQDRAGNSRGNILPDRGKTRRARHRRIIDIVNLCRLPRDRLAATSPDVGRQLSRSSLPSASGTAPISTIRAFAGSRPVVSAIDHEASSADQRHRIADCVPFIPRTMLSDNCDGTAQKSPMGPDVPSRRTVSGALPCDGPQAHFVVT